MRSLYALLLLASAAAAPALAHHGWGWTDGGEFTLTGTIAAAELGNPHGVLTVEVG